jgi:DnaK suppressor protein
MATETTKKKAAAGKTAKTSKTKRAVATKTTAAKKAPVAKKSTASKKTSAKVQRKASKKPSSEKKAAVVSKLSKAEKAARRRKMSSYLRLLKAKRERLLQAYNISKSNTRIESRDGTEDYIDYAVSSYHRDFTLSLTELDRQQLKLVDQALTRLRLRAYGDCQHCSAVIPEQRLDVEPWARHCIRCQELEEQGLLEPPDIDPDQEEEEEEAILEAEPAVGDETESEGQVDDEDGDSTADDG